MYIDVTNNDRKKINETIIDQNYNPESENAQSGKAVAEAVNGKQNTLVSGTNIKTINGNSILGSGNITIEGGSSSSITIDQIYSPESENAQSGKAVAEALSGYVVAEVGKGLSSNDFTNEDKEKLYSALQNENVDQTYIPNSENPQSGKAVAKAVSDKQDSLVSGTNIKTINNQSILGSGNITIEGGSGSSITIDQTFDPESENAQSGIAIDKYVTDNFSDIIIETSHSVNSPAEIDCCLKGQKIVGGNILGAEPQIVQNKNLCPTPEPTHQVRYDNNSNIIGEYTLTVNSDGTFNISYTGKNVYIPDYAYVKVPAGVYTISGYVPFITCRYDDAINEPTVTWISSSAIKDVIIARFEKSGFIIVYDEGYSVNAENLYIQIEEGTKATPFVKYNGRQLYLPKNPIMHFSPVNPIQNRTFIGDEITFGEIYSNYLSYKFNSNYATGFSVNSARIEIGQEYIMRFQAACYTKPYNTWGFGVFSAQKYSSAYNVAAKSLLTIRLARTGEIVYQSNPQSISYTDFSKLNLLKLGTPYIIELVFTSSYSGEVYFGMRAEGKPVILGLKSCMFCKPESLPMLVDQKINTNLLSIGSISDSIDLATGQKIQQIMMDELSFEEEQLVVNNYNKALPSIPAYFVSGTLEDSDWIECVTPAAGTNNYTLTKPLSKGYIVYATRRSVTEQLEFELPVVCTDEFEVYTSSDDNMVPYYQTSIDTKKSANSYLKKILNTIISMGGNI